MSKPSIAAIIVGIDGWEQYTEPLIWSIYEHEPDCHAFIVDNASLTPYPIDGTDDHLYWTMSIHRREERACYSKAINYGKSEMGGPFDWYIVLSNDVLCTAPFADMLASYDGKDLVGPLMKNELGFPYLEGWCVCVPAAAWQSWDERFLGSDYEDVAYSTAARQRGFGLMEDKGLPFKHLDQRQRYTVVDDFAGKNAHNRALFLREYAAVRV